MVSAWTGQVGRQARGSQLAAHGALLFASVVWAANASVVKVGLRHVHPVEFLTARFAVAALVLGGIALAWHRDEMRKGPPWRLVLPAALLGIVPNQLFFTFGVDLSTVVDISLIMGLCPFMVALLVLVLTRSAPPPRQVVALFVGFAGLAVVVLESGRSGGGSLAGDLLGLGLPVSWAVYIVTSSRARAISPTSFMAWLLVVAAAIMLPVAGGAMATAPTGDDWQAGLLPLTYSSLLSTGLSYVAFFWGMRRVGVTGSAIYSYLQPPLGALMGAVFLGEKVGAAQLVGAVLILLAAYLGSWRREKATEPEEREAEAAA
jgi:drug/metabolite transporter (DMT)-like permease